VKSPASKIPNITYSNSRKKLGS